MIYTIEKANLLANQLNRFATSYAHHLAGQFANVEFWLDETEAALKTIDEYNKRFLRLRDAQKEWVENHGTVVYEYCPHCGGRCEFADGTPSPPVRYSSQELKTVRRNLVESFREFLLRCYRAGHLDENALEIMFNRVGTSIEPSDLRRKK